MCSPSVDLNWCPGDGTYRSPDSPKTGSFISSPVTKWLRWCNGHFDESPAMMMIIMILKWEQMKVDENIERCWDWCECGVTQAGDRPRCHVWQSPSALARQCPPGWRWWSQSWGKHSYILTCMLLVYNGLQFTHNNDECSNITRYHAGWYTCCVGSKLSKIKFFPHSLILTGFNGFAGGWCACWRPWCLHELGKKTLKGGGRKSWVPTARAITPTTPPPASSPAIHPDSNNLPSFNYMHWAVTYYMLHSYQVMQSRYQVAIDYRL